MLIALLKGKLSRDQENMEDILTSNVFGLMKYLPPGEALFPFLKCAEDIEGDNPLANLSQIATAEYEFWPMVKESDCIRCEPDLIIRIHDGGNDYLLFIEAKYLSGKSSEEDQSIEAPYDQLAREWDNLICMAKRENAKPLLIYVTADIGLPLQDIEISANEYFRKRKDQKDSMNFECAWISWRKLSTVFFNTPIPAAQDLYALVDRMGLCYFESIPSLDLTPLKFYNFHSNSDDFHWETPQKVKSIWSFLK